MMTNKTVTFAIGDVHGMADHFNSLIGAIFEYTRDNNVEEWRIVTLGDYIDRGPNSKGVVDTTIQLSKKYPGKIITLRGNHEQMLLDSLAGIEDDLHLFLINGGDATLASYGVSRIQDIPFEHKQFFRDTLMHYEDDLRYFVHAGVNPYYSLAEQNDWDKVWIRDIFLDYRSKFPKYIVHGHTPRPRDTNAGLYGNRCNLDFGAVFGGKLVCTMFNNEEEEPFNYIAVSG